MVRKANNKASSAVQAEFLALEYSQLWIAKESINQRQFKLGQLYVFAVGGFFAAVLAVHKLAPSVSVLTFGAAASLMIALLGTYAYVVALSSLFSFVFYIRAINNIRRYFSQLCPENSKYFSLPTDKRSPSMGSFSLHCALYSLLNAFFFAMACSMCILQFGQSSVDVFTATIVGFIVLAGVLVLNYGVYRIIRRTRLRRGTKLI